MNNRLYKTADISSNNNVYEPTSRLITNTTHKEILTNYTTVFSLDTFGDDHLHQKFVIDKEQDHAMKNNNELLNKKENIIEYEEYKIEKTIPTKENDFECIEPIDQNNFTQKIPEINRHNNSVHVTTNPNEQRQQQIIFPISNQFNEQTKLKSVQNLRMSPNNNDDYDNIHNVNNIHVANNSNLIMSEDDDDNEGQGEESTISQRSNYQIKVPQKNEELMKDRNYYSMNDSEKTTQNKFRMQNEMENPNEENLKLTKRRETIMSKKEILDNLMENNKMMINMEEISNQKSNNNLIIKKALIEDFQSLKEEVITIQNSLKYSETYNKKFEEALLDQNIQINKILQNFMNLKEENEYLKKSLNTLTNSNGSKQTVILSSNKNETDLNNIKNKCELELAIAKKSSKFYYDELKFQKNIYEKKLKNQDSVIQDLQKMLMEKDDIINNYKQQAQILQSNEHYFKIQSDISTVYQDINQYNKQHMPVDLWNNDSLSAEDSKDTKVQNMLKHESRSIRPDHGHNLNSQKAKRFHSSDKYKITKNNDEVNIEDEKIMEINKKRPLSHTKFPKKIYLDEHTLSIQQEFNQLSIKNKPNTTKTNSSIPINLKECENNHLESHEKKSKNHSTKSIKEDNNNNNEQAQDSIIIVNKQSPKKPHHIANCLHETSFGDISFDASFLKDHQMKKKSEVEMHSINVSPIKKKKNIQKAKDDDINIGGTGNVNPTDSLFYNEQFMNENSMMDGSIDINSKMMMMMMIDTRLHSQNNIFNSIMIGPNSNGLKKHEYEDKDMQMENQFYGNNSKKSQTKLTKKEPFTILENVQCYRKDPDDNQITDLGSFETPKYHDLGTINGSRRGESLITNKNSANGQKNVVQVENSNKGLTASFAQKQSKSSVNSHGISHKISSNDSKSKLFQNKDSNFQQKAQNNFEEIPQQFDNNLVTYGKNHDNVNFSNTIEKIHDSKSNFLKKTNNLTPSSISKANTSVINSRIQDNNKKNNIIPVLESKHGPQLYNIQEFGEENHDESYSKLNNNHPKLEQRNKKSKYPKHRREKSSGTNSSCSIGSRIPKNKNLSSQNGLLVKGNPIYDNDSMVFNQVKISSPQINKLRQEEEYPQFTKGLIPKNNWLVTNDENYKIHQKSGKSSVIPTPKENQAKNFYQTTISSKFMEYNNPNCNNSKKFQKSDLVMDFHHLENVPILTTKEKYKQKSINDDNNHLSKKHHREQKINKNQNKEGKYHSSHNENITEINIQNFSDDINENGLKKHLNLTNFEYKERCAPILESIHPNINEKVICHKEYSSNNSEPLNNHILSATIFNDITNSHELYCQNHNPNPNNRKNIQYMPMHKQSKGQIRTENHKIIEKIQNSEDNYHKENKYFPFKPLDSKSYDQKLDKEESNKQERKKLDKYEKPDKDKSYHNSFSLLLNQKIPENYSTILEINGNESHNKMNNNDDDDLINKSSEIFYHDDDE